MFQQAGGPWVRFRDTLSGVVEIDFHSDLPLGPIYAIAGQIEKQLLAALEYAQAKGYQHLLIRHGSSTSRPGWTTIRSVVRGFMRGPQSTPYVYKSRSIQHESVFVAAVRPGCGAVRGAIQEVTARKGGPGDVHTFQLIFDDPEYALAIDDAVDVNLEDYH